LDAEASDDSPPIVGVVREAVAVASDLLGEHVDVLDASVGGPAGLVVGKDLVGPPVDGAGEAGDLADFGVGAPLEVHDEQPPGVTVINGGVHVPEEFLSVNRPS